MILDIIVYVSLTLVFIVTLYPIWYVFMASFSSTQEVALSGGILLWPKKFMTGAYELIFKDKLIMKGFKNSILIEAISLPINLILTLFCGYFMAKSNMMLKKPITLMFVFTMFFSGGMIPAYLNIRSLGLYNSIWALILPGAVTYYNSVICRTAIMGIPESLSESAYIDGANDFQVLWQILTPLIKPTLAVLVLYYGVSHWNAWFNASIYLSTNDWIPIANVLRALLLAGESNNNFAGNIAGDEADLYAETVKYAAIVVSTFPILCVYPFLQKYFAKGAMIGAVKG